VPVLASCKSPWAALRRSVKGLSVEFSLLSERAAQQVLCRPHIPRELVAHCYRGIECVYLIQGRREEDDVVEKLNLFLDLLQSYRVSTDAFFFVSFEKFFFYFFVYF